MDNGVDITERFEVDLSRAWIPASGVFGGRSRADQPDDAVAVGSHSSDDSGAYEAGRSSDRDMHLLEPFALGKPRDATAAHAATMISP